MKLIILGGKAKGIPLAVPASARPSPVRLRKALFDYLRLRFPKKGKFLDLYAGSGAVGLEAASEGFSVVLVEKDRQAIALLRKNAARARLPVGIQPVPVEKYLAHPGGERFQIAFIAPPYPHNLEEDFTRLLNSGIVETGGLYILQHPAKLHWPKGERRVYGSNALTIIESQGHAT